MYDRMSIGIVAGKRSTERESPRRFGEKWMIRKIR